MSHTFRIVAACLVAAPLALGFAAPARAADVTGAGASFIYPVMSKWSADYHKSSGKQINYQSIRFGRRHRTDQGWHGRLRLIRRAAETG
jgi:ABC-type phosphate transport system substrate-binding protein